METELVLEGDDLGEDEDHGLEVPTNPAPVGTEAAVRDDAEATAAFEAAMFPGWGPSWHGREAPGGGIGGGAGGGGEGGGGGGGGGGYGALLSGPHAEFSFDNVTLDQLFEAVLHEVREATGVRMSVHRHTPFTFGRPPPVQRPEAGPNKGKCSCGVPVSLLHGVHHACLNGPTLWLVITQVTWCSSCILIAGICAVHLIDGVTASASTR